MILQCPHCQMRVLPLANGLCPSCNAHKWPVDDKLAAGAANDLPDCYSLATAHDSEQLASERRCALCGSSNTELRTFYLRAMSTKTVGGRIERAWINFPAECCANCYRQLSWLQTWKALTYVIMAASLAPAMLAVFLTGHSTDRVGIISVIGIAVGVLGSTIVGSLRKGIVESSPLALNLQRIWRAEQPTILKSDCKVIPLASVGQESVLSWSIDPFR